MGEQGAGAEGDSEASRLAQKEVCNQYKWGIGKAVVEEGC